MFDSIIIGGGPAGMTAALYLLRAGKTVLVIEKEGFGGQIAKSPRLENFPSINSISGTDFSSNLFDQITTLGAEFELDTVESINKINARLFEVKTQYNKFESKTVILATGCEHRKLGAQGEDRLAGKGVSYCAVCDGDFYRGEDVTLIGDANTACQYAILLSDICHSVHMVALFDHLFADDILIKRLQTLPNFSVVFNKNTLSFNGENELESITYEDTKTKEVTTVPCKGAFVAVGQIPCNEKFADLVDLEKGFILTNEQMETKTTGLYAIGDCRVKKIRQVITATSDGAIAALDIVSKL